MSWTCIRKEVSYFVMLVSRYLSEPLYADVFKYELVEPDTEISATIDEMNADAETVEMSKTQAERDRKKKAKVRITVQHVDIIKDDFWLRRPWLLSGRPGKILKEP